MLCSYDFVPQIIDLSNLKMPIGMPSGTDLNETLIPVSQYQHWAKKLSYKNFELIGFNQQVDIATPQFFDTSTQETITFGKILQQLMPLHGNNSLDKPQCKYLYGYTRFQIKEWFYYMPTSAKRLVLYYLLYNDLNNNKPLFVPPIGEIEEIETFYYSLVKWIPYIQRFSSGFRSFIQFLQRHFNYSPQQAIREAWCVIWYAGTPDSLISSNLIGTQTAVSAIDFDAANNTFHIKSMPLYHDGVLQQATLQKIVNIINSILIEVRTSSTLPTVRVNGVERACDAQRYTADLLRLKLYANHIQLSTEAAGALRDTQFLFHKFKQEGAFVTVQELAELLPPDYNPVIPALPIVEASNGVYYSFDFAVQDVVYCGKSYKNTIGNFIERIKPNTIDLTDTAAVHTTKELYAAMGITKDVPLMQRLVKNNIIVQVGRGKYTISERTADAAKNFYF